MIEYWNRKVYMKEAKGVWNRKGSMKPVKGVFMYSSGPSREESRDFICTGNENAQKNDEVWRRKAPLFAEAA